MATRKTRRALGLLSTLAITATLGLVTAGPAGAAVTPGAAQALPLKVTPSIACASSTTCIVAGDDFGTGMVTIPVENGIVGTESVQASPSSSEPNSIACASSTFCIIGGNIRGGLIGHPTITTVGPGGMGVTQLTPSGGSLNAVACASPAECFAVTQLPAGPGPSADVVPVTNGTPQFGIAVPDSSNVRLKGIACESETECMAVGELPVGLSGAGGIIVPISNGQPGEPISIPSVTGFTSVACPSSTKCYAVGTSGNQAIVAPILVGGAGHISTLNQPVGSSLVDNPTSIACSSAISCVAVGVRTPVGGSASDEQMLIVPVVGGEFGSAQTSPGSLDSVACSNSSSCGAVGFDTNGVSQYLPLAISATATNTALTASPSATTYGTSTTLTATVTSTIGATIPTGSVTFTAGTTVLGSAPLNNGTARLATSALPGGIQTVTATYSGDPDFASSTGGTVVSVAPASTTLTAVPTTKINGTFRATLTRADNDAPIAGQTVVFTTSGLNGAADTVCTARTDASGVASCTGRVPLADQLHDTIYTARFAATADYRATTATASLTSPLI